MILNIINSGSDGNCCVLTDSKGHQIILDCGLPYNQIIEHTDFQKIDFVLTSHVHQDHYKSVRNFKHFLVPCYEPANVKDGAIINTIFWSVVPMKLSHNVECYGFLIYSKLDRKKIAYITDTNYIPKLGNVDMLIVDCNYDEDIIAEKKEKGITVHLGYKNHSSNQSVARYLTELPFKIPLLVAYHISNSSLNEISKVEEVLSPFTDKLVISKPNTIIEF